jgi:hypothetical protein
LVYGGLAGGFLAIASAVKRGAFVSLLKDTMGLLSYWFSGGRAGKKVDLEDDGVHTVPYGLAIAAGGLLAWFAPLSLGGML